jgi:signal transduction histidine kinase
MRAPALALALLLAAGLAIPPNTPFALVALVPLFVLAREGGARTGAAGAFAIGAVSVAHDVLWDTELSLGGIVATFALAGAVAVGGLYAGARRSHAARERELLGASAAADERLRIARELHDAVGHEVSLMVVQLQALGATSPEVAPTTEAIADHGRRAMAEMHRTLTLLRSDDEPAALGPSPGLDGLDAVVDGARAAGLDVSLTVEGTPRSLPAALELSAYRIVQEALTNTVRHAGRAAAVVTLRYAPERLEIDVVDDGEAGPPGHAGGHGLAGMRERVALFGGAFAAGPGPGGGFEVRATLPYDP